MRAFWWTSMLGSVVMAAMFGRSKTDAPSSALSTASTSIDNLTSQWSSWWGDNYKFITIADEGEDFRAVLDSCNYSSAVVAILDGPKPQRRNVSSEPFIEILHEQPNALAPHSLTAEEQFNGQQILSQKPLSEVLGFPALNSGIGMIEYYTWRVWYPIRIDFRPFEVSTPGCRKPYAVWNVSSGIVYTDQELVNNMSDHLDQISRITGPLATSLTSHIDRFIATNLVSNSKDSLWNQLVAYVVPGALLVAVGSQVPIWFCIACPVVLGLLAPFIFNAGFGEAAEAICTHYSLSVDECNDLWYGAFAAAMVLSLASAIPIVYICQIPKCGRTGSH